MSFVEVNIWGILLAILANMVIGAMWYSPLLFSNQWMKGIGKTREEIEGKGANIGYMLTTVAALVSALVLSLLIQLFDNPSIADGALIGFLCGFGIAAMRELSPTFFEGRRLVLYFISVGYHIVSLTVMGMIIASFM